MSHPRVEEVSDSDPDAGASSDPEEGDIDDFADADIMRRIPTGNNSGGGGGSRSSGGGGGGGFEPSPAARPQMFDPAGLGGGDPTRVSDADHGVYKGFQSLYPVYFDATRSRAEGRRVSARLAVRNPLAREIAHACSRLRLQTLLEPDKVHPKDWANPGRVKVGLKKAGAGAAVKNKHHLYLLVAQHLAANPTADDSPGLRVRIGGQLQPPEGAPYPRPAVPRGWKMGELLPYLSAAMTGGGVSENLFKDMMKEMQSGGDPMAALMAGQQQQPGPGGGAAGGAAADEGAAGKKKKDKKGKARA
ncbi:SRP19 protein [Hirsutella rhossiliensis]|uniref:SRP19 protein n=1 Tax=Hirsutella rhossiliensis TaxID=111463 RepID=A0A9P8N9I3_9HYPO|nr:SRP19 protein [Hirsutella rhossiliensis]KAH0967092.1 SRP19 protein [Hirsutella rhossiliensis]